METSMSHVRPTPELKISLRHPRSEKKEKRKIKDPQVKTSS